MKKLKNDKLKKNGRIIYVQIGCKVYSLVAEFEIEGGYELADFLDNHTVMLIKPTNL